MSTIFIYNELMMRHVQQTLRIPLTFISFAHIDAKLYSHHGMQSVFANVDGKRKWGNSKVYGALFHINDSDFYFGLLDASHTCSRNKLNLNHTLDLHHRIILKATPIHFASLDEFSSLKYREGNESVQSYVYVGNPKHPKITSRITPTKWSYRFINGVDARSFSQCFREELQHANGK